MRKRELAGTVPNVGICVGCCQRDRAALCGVRSRRRVLGGVINQYHGAA